MGNPKAIKMATFSRDPEFFDFRDLLLERRKVPTPGRR